MNENINLMILGIKCSCPKKLKDIELSVRGGFIQFACWPEGLIRE